MKRIITIIISIICLLCLSAIFMPRLGKIFQSSLYCGNGSGLYKLGRYGEAIFPLEKAIKIRPETARAHYFLALTYEKLGQADKALSLLDSYLNNIAHATEKLTGVDKQYIPQCKQLLAELKDKVEAQAP